MSSASSRSYSPSQNISNRHVNLHYEPALYCKCDLKSPLCTSRDSGRKFFGCQQWKGNGCGYFVFVDDIMLNAGVIGVDSEVNGRGGRDELKQMIEAWRTDASITRLQVEAITRLQVEAITSQNNGN